MIPIQIKRKMNTDALRQVEPLNVLLFEGEVNAHQFLIEPADGVSFAGAAVTAFFVRADNQRVDLTGAVTGEGEAAVTLGPNCYATPGRYRLTIFVTIGEETAAVYACCGSVQPTRGSEVAGDTEPIVEPTAPDLTPITDRLTSIDGKYWGPYGASLTVDGVAITQQGPFLTLNGTTTTGAYVKLDGGLTTGKYSDLVAMAQTGNYADGSAPKVSFVEISGSYTSVESDGITPSSPYGFAIVMLSTDSAFNDMRFSPNGPFGIGKIVSEAGTYGFILMLIANHTFDNYRIYLAVEDANRYHFLKDSLDSRYAALEARVAALEG